MVTRWHKKRVLVAVALTVVAGLLFLNSRSQYGPANGADAYPPWSPQGGASSSSSQSSGQSSSSSQSQAKEPVPPTDAGGGQSRWSTLPLKYPLAPEEVRPVPKASAVTLRGIPAIQHVFAPETATARAVRLARLAEVRSNFTHAWNGYRQHAWLADELKPVTGQATQHFGGWAATLVDTLDTLWIMGMTAEFEEAVRAVDQIDFDTFDGTDLNVFETTIRYLGGFLAAYDLSGGQYPSLLRKARELGEMLSFAFDTPNHLPVTRWKMLERRQGVEQRQHKTSLVSELGSLTLEFTRLSQLTGDAKYYDLVARIMDRFADQQDHTKLPGLWPVIVDAASGDFTGSAGFTIGGMADSLYEYLPKAFLMLGGAVPMYRDMYVKSLETMQKHIFFYPRANNARPMLFAGDKNTNGQVPAEQITTVPKAQHLGCFAGGMVALGAKLFGRPQDMATATQLVEGCIWAYESAPAGVMAEIVTLSQCPGHAPCAWDEDAWLADVSRTVRVKLQGTDGTLRRDEVRAAAAAAGLRDGVYKYDDLRYILRPEAIESVFVLYRLTGDATLLDRAWGMFEAIVAATKTPIAHTAVRDATRPRDTPADSMESFWLAETLKYFYLIFSEPDVVSLDQYVLNTEAHPMLRPVL